MANSETGEVYRLLKEYCDERSCRRSPEVLPQKSAAVSAVLSPWRGLRLKLPSSSSGVAGDGRMYRAGKVRRSVTKRLGKLAESAPIADEGLETQDEIIQRLVQLMITFGDDINVKLNQNPALQKQLQNLNYDLFVRLTSGVQNLVAPASPALGPDQIQKQKIAWAFEVTSRLSAIGVVHQRRVLGFGAQYIQENHVGWVQQHGGWEGAFTVD